MVEKKEMCSSACVEPGVGIVLINIEELYDFNGHPFKVERDQELFELRQSIEREGIIVSLIVRNHPNGKGYEILAGHRRKEAAKWAGMTEVPAVIRNLDDDKSVLVMVDSNLQREKILPSEKAFAYKMRLDAFCGGIVFSDRRRTVRSLCSDGSGTDNPKSFSGKPYEADEPAGTT